MEPRVLPPRAGVGLSPRAQDPVGCTDTRVYSSIFMIKTKSSPKQYTAETVSGDGSVCMDLAAKGWISPPPRPAPRPSPVPCLSFPTARWGDTADLLLDAL